MISRAKSTGTSPLGIPSNCTRPPRRTAANAWCSADGTPDISHTTSAPSPPVSSSTVRTTSSAAALIVTCAPMRRASANRLAFTSEAITLAAPAGPAPGHAAARRDDLPGELVTHDQRRLDPPLRPRVPVGDMDIGAAHAGVAHRDEHLTRAGRWLRHRRDLQAGGASLFYDCLHDVRDAGSRMRDASENGSGEPPVHLQHGSGNIAGPLGREERDRRRKLVGAAHAAEWDTRH